MSDEQQPAILLEGVGKRFRQTDDKKSLIPSRSRRAREHWALRDIDLRVEPGETIGIIGRNGSGKTTLLRLLAGVSAPSAGRMVVVGTIAPLIGIGVGFDPELTGRENVFANGRILGMSQDVLERDFDEIVGFAELEEFIDTPVKFYSSGMFLRLAFAVAIHVEPDVLLVDEVLAVGDLAFQLKCFSRMAALQERGTTVVVVTHNLGVVRRMCRRAVVLRRGVISFDGDVEPAIGIYHQHLAEGPGGADVTTGSATVTVELENGDHNIPGTDAVVARVCAQFDAPVEDPGIRLIVGGTHVPTVYEVVTRPRAGIGTFGPNRPLEARIRLDNRLLTGTYHVDVHVLDASGEETIGASAPLPFFVSSTARGFGLVDLRAQLSIAGRDIALNPVPPPT